MDQIIRTFINEQNLLKQDKIVLVGVSGGSDSLALLHYLLSIKAEMNLQVIAISVDHQLRGEESREDLEYVRKLCLSWGVPFFGASLDVASYKAEHCLGTQIAAREVRYKYFEEQMVKQGADYLALGHHADDQVETMLMRFSRQASSTALTGIPVKRAFACGEIIRPLLCVQKKTIEAYCRANNIVPRIDPSNEQVDYTRNYYRKYIIPLINKKNSNIHNTIQRLSLSLEADNQFLEMEAEKLVKRIVSFTQEPLGAMLEIDLFKTYPIALQRRCYHLILKYLYNVFPDKLTYVNEDIFFCLLHNEKGNVQMDFPGDLKIEKSYNRLLFYFGKVVPENCILKKEVLVPGETVLPNGRIISAKFVERDDLNLNESEKDHYLIAADATNFPLYVRTRAYGDRMRWKGLNGSKKLKDIFIDAKIPLREREIWPIITDKNDEILWLVGLRKKAIDVNLNSTTYIDLYYEQGNGGHN